MLLTKAKERGRGNIKYSPVVKARTCWEFFSRSQYLAQWTDDAKTRKRINSDMWRQRTYLLLQGDTETREYNWPLTCPSFPSDSAGKPSAIRPGAAEKPETGNNNSLSFLFSLLLLSIKEDCLTMETLNTRRYVNSSSIRIDYISSHIVYYSVYIA